ncbi:MAG: peptidoglycan DD-metalloendopeptidase family protein [Actinobacteria bacterium]|nr:peptidoglycan DD-metalloendopeptidase family protein [Actinomycetota bacterium]
MRSTRVLFGSLLLVTMATPGATGAASYRQPVAIDDMVFPVARSTWYSVIGFEHDWHAPRMRLIGGRWRQVGVHQGNDVFAEPGTPVRAIHPGRVENLGWTFYSGWRIGIRGDDGRYWFYAHLRRFAPRLTEGSRVRAGSTIGEVGNTGYGQDPGHADEFTYHLHVGIQEPDGTWIDPYPLLQELYDGTVKTQR